MLGQPELQIRLLHSTPFPMMLTVTFSPVGACRLPNIISGGLPLVSLPTLHMVQCPQHGAEPATLE